MPACFRGENPKHWRDGAAFVAAARIPVRPHPFSPSSRPALTFRFIHTADLHLDSPLVTLALRDRDLADSLGIASRAALGAIVDLALARQVDALLIAGDLWDGSQVSAKTPGLLKQELRRLDEAGIRCFIIRGNHDAMSKVTRELDPPPNTVVFGARAKTHRFEAGGHEIAVHGLSFADPHAPASLLPLYPAAVAGAFNIGLMHTSLNGAEGHDVYAPCALADLDAFGYDYWALGHIHRRAEYHGRAHVVMAGIPQGRDIGEAGETSVTLGELSDQGVLTLSRHCVAGLRFERLDVAVDGIDDWPALLARIEGALLAAARAPRPEEHLVLRPRLTGAGPLAWRIARDLGRLLAEAESFASGQAGLWIDKLENATLAPDGAGETQLPDELSRIVLEDLPQDAGLVAALDQAMADLQRDLPADLGGIFGDDAASAAAERGALLAQGSAALLRRLTLAPAGGPAAEDG